MEHDLELHQGPTPPHSSDATTQTLIAIQEQIMRMQESHEEVLRVLKDYGLTERHGDAEGVRNTNAGTPPIKESTTEAARSNRKGPKPALPADFDGERIHGRAFLNSVRWYLRTRASEFQSLDQMVSWTLSFMKSGRALTFANQITRRVEKDGAVPYRGWDDFWKELESRFLPIDEAEEAINTLETDRYFQGKQTVDDYCDRFADLVDHAGYSDGRQVVMKFRKGLDLEVADKVALLQEQRPSDDDLDAWIRMAKEIARQRTRNEAFNQTVRKDKAVVKTATHLPVKSPPFFRLNTPTPPKPLLPMITSTTPKTNASASLNLPVSKPTGTGPVPMEVDAFKSRNRSPMACHRCGQPGHFKNQCPRRFDIRYMSMEEVEEHMQNQATQADLDDLATAAPNEIEGEGLIQEEVEQRDGEDFGNSRE
jgi:hypothetical protein